MQPIELNMATDPTGAATTTDNRKVYGKLHAVQLVDGDLADGVDLTLTCETPHGSIPLLTIANWNIDQVLYPRALEHLNTDGTVLTTHTEPLIAGQIKAVIAQGGDTKTGVIACHIE